MELTMTPYALIK